MRSAVSSRTHSSSSSSSSRAIAASEAWIRAFASSFSASPPSSRSSAWISFGSVRPWSSSVVRITQNVRNTIRLRSGNASPASVVSGSASAAASETAPRIPHQPRTAFARQLGMTSCSRAQWLTRRGRYVVTKTQTIRATITTPLTSAAYPISVAVE